MSDFEFQRYITIGQYLPQASVIHRLDPRARLLGGLVLLLAITVAPHLAGLAIAIVALLVLIRLAHLPLGYTLKGLLPPLPFILILALLQVLLSPQVNVADPWFAWGPFAASPASFISGAEIIVRFAALILCITILSATTSTPEAVRGLESLMRPLGRIGLPAQDVVLMVQVALRFLPLLAREAERIAKSQASRGAEWGTGRRGLIRRVRQALPLLIPLFLVSLQRAENLAMAMEARGYQSRAERTSLVAMEFASSDVVALLLALALAVLIVFL